MDPQLRHRPSASRPLARRRLARTATVCATALVTCAALAGSGLTSSAVTRSTRAPRPRVTRVVPSSLPTVTRSTRRPMPSRPSVPTSIARPAVTRPAAVPFFTTCAGNGAPGTPFVTGHNCRTMEHERLNRQYIVAIPPGLPAGPVPVVFVLHGTSGNGGEFANRTQYGWANVAAAQGIVLVYPTALRLCALNIGAVDQPGVQECALAAPQGGQATRWNSGQPGLIDADDLPINLDGVPVLPNDLTFFDAMVADLTASGIQIADPGLFVSGFSSGGCMTSTIAMVRSHDGRRCEQRRGMRSVDERPGDATHPDLLPVGTMDDRLSAAQGVPLPLPFDAAGMVGLISGGIITPFSTAAGVDPATYTAAYMTNYTVGAATTPTRTPASNVLTMTWTTAAAGVTDARAFVAVVTRGIGTPTSCRPDR